MYIPAPYAEHDPETLFAYIDAHPLATLVSGSATDGLYATHLPLVLNRDAAPSGVLVGHLARANPHHRVLASGSGEALAIFTGPDAYITPEWYPAKREHGRVVPTWNYIAVHAYGTLHLRDYEDFLRQHLEMLTTRHESPRPQPWHVSDAPAEFIAQQMKAIVGFELTIARLEGKWKMSQNRSDADITGVVQGLAASADPDDRAVAAIVAERRPGARR